MHLLAAPFIISGLVLKIYNNRKNRQTKDQQKSNEQLNKIQKTPDDQQVEQLH